MEAINRLKHLPRKGWIERGLPPDSVESVAAHSFGIAALLLVLREFFSIPRDVPFELLLSLSVLHDLPESETGDLTPEDNVSRAEKTVRERDAVARICEQLPASSDLRAMLDAVASHDVAAGGKGIYQKALSFIHQVDKLDMMIQALFYEQEHGIDLSEFYADAGKKLTDPALLEFFESFKSYISG